MEDAKYDLEAHAAVAALDAHQRFAIDAGPVSELVLRQAAKFPPRLDVASDFAQRAADWERRR